MWPCSPGLREELPASSPLLPVGARTLFTCLEPRWSFADYSLRFLQAFSLTCKVSQSPEGQKRGQTDRHSPHQALLQMAPVGGTDIDS